MSLPSAAQFGYLARSFVFLRFELLGFGQRRAALGIQRAELLEIELIPARSQTLGDGVQVRPEEGEIMHVKNLAFSRRSHDERGMNTDVATQL